MSPVPYRGYLIHISVCDNTGLYTTTFRDPEGLDHLGWEDEYEEEAIAHTQCLINEHIIEQEFDYLKRDSKLAED